MTDDTTTRLTAQQRARLRRSVDATALERLLARVPDAERRLLLLQEPAHTWRLAPVVALMAC